MTCRIRPGEQRRGMLYCHGLRLPVAGLLLALLTSLGDVRAAFELAGRIPESLRADGEVEVVRERIEERDTQPVAKGRLEAGVLALRVEAEPGLYRLRIGSQETPFVVGEGQRLVVGTAEGDREVRLEGSPDHALFLAYEALRRASLRQHVLTVREAQQAARSRGDAAAVDRLTEAEVEGYRVHRRELIDFTLSRLAGSPALYAASLRWEGDYRLAELAAVVRDFVKTHPDWQISRRLESRVRGFESLALGAPAPELAGRAPDGSAVALSGLRGKVVLLDFWASWCGPCRSENRHYVELYQTHRDAGFEILAVSVDHDERGWKAAIAKDRATWRHLSDLVGWKSPLAATYQVTALPASFLIDREGRIVAKDLRGAALTQELKRQLALGR
ncbi:MAG TPA: TlpA disulfide reductase family protein [Opitutaceae bacterium]|nr:TlpA disulfide reductase family protein [Opitutaceae bacterium]